MNNDQIALYLNDQPEFFNQYPELLARIQAIAPEDLPLPPAKTLNIADRLLKRAQADKEHIKNQLVSFMEITQANEKIQENLFAIDRIIMYNLNFSQMIGQLCEEIIKRFKPEFENLVYLSLMLPVTDPGAAKLAEELISTN